MAPFGLDRAGQEMSVPTPMGVLKTAQMTRIDMFVAL